MEEDRIWVKLVEITGAIGECKTSIATCAANIQAGVEITAMLSNHVRDSNGKVADIMGRLANIELANAKNCSEQKGARRQWGIIAAVIVVAAAVAGTAGTFIGLVIH